MYDKEELFIQNAKNFLLKEDISLEEMKSAYLSVISKYDELLRDIRFVIKVSDRLQNKLRTINENLADQAEELEKAKNIISTKNDELTVAKTKLEEKVEERTQELIRLNHELMMSNAELDNFVYRASHDIKGPIMSMIGLCNLAEMETEDPRTIEYVQMLSSTAQGLKNVLMRLLSIDKLKKIEKSPESLYLKDILQQTELFFKQLPLADKIDFEFDCPDHVQLYSDRQILTILLENLIDFCVKNINVISNKPQIFLKVIPTEKDLQIFITYSGESIPEEFIKEIFTLFYRISNQHIGTELYSASLATAKLGGNLQLLQSTPEETIFSVFLPDIIECNSILSDNM